MIWICQAFCTVKFKTLNDYGLAVILDSAIIVFRFPRLSKLPCGLGNY